MPRFGRRPVAHLHHLGILGPHLIADHCVALDERDMALADTRYRWSTTPKAT